MYLSQTGFEKTTIFFIFSVIRTCIYGVESITVYCT